jgi:hypothetical protein
MSPYFICLCIKHNRVLEMGVIAVAIPVTVDLVEAAKAMITLLTSTLCLRLAQDDDQPLRKRRRDNFVELDVPFRVWQGRRQRRRQLQGQSKGGQLGLEAMVSSV